MAHRSIVGSVGDTIRDRPLRSKAAARGGRRKKRKTPSEVMKERRKAGGEYERSPGLSLAQTVLETVHEGTRGVPGGFAGVVRSTAAGARVGMHLGEALAKYQKSKRKQSMQSQAAQFGSLS